MRAAAIFGLGSSTKDLKPFQARSEAEWIIGMPSSSTDADAILIFGGDGTVHRHLAQLIALRLPVLVVPSGSGNDFARALNLGSVRDSSSAWQEFSSGGGNVRSIDLGVIAPHPTHGTGLAARHYFCCIAGVGLDGEVARRANKLPRWLRGHGGYILSLLPALLRFAPALVRISLPQGEQLGSWTTRSAQPTFVAAFANGPAYGGGMKVAPRAQLDDGRLDVCLVADIDKSRLFCLFPTVYFGRHLSIPEVEYFQAERLLVEADRPLEVWADGEYVCQTPVEVSVARGALQVVMPAE